MGVRNTSIYAVFRTNVDLKIRGRNVGAERDRSLSAKTSQDLCTDAR
jgi:hypothetical protein